MKYQFNFAFDNRLIEKLGYEPEGQVVLVIRAVMDAIRLAEKNKVVFVTDDLEAKTLFETTVIGNGEFGCDDECIFIETPVINKKTDMSMWLEWSKGIDMQFSTMVINPPYSIGNKIISEVVKHLTKDGKAVVIQPLGQYKKQKLFEHVETFELTDPKIFEDASITRNLCICTLKKEPMNKYTWKALFMDSCDQSLRKFYDWNIENTRNLIITQTVYQPPSKFNIDTDVIESGRYVGLEHGYGYHAKNCCAYSFNVLNTVVSSNWIKNIAFIRFPSKHAKQNYCKYIYNYTTDKYDCLESKALCGLHITTAAQEYSFFIPQIDWETIDQHPLWNTDVDAAVLDAMGLKWNGDKSKIINK